MGVRCWELSCKKCGNEELTRFEHLTKQEAIEKVQETECSKCGSHNVYFNGITSFSGGERREKEKVLVWCKDCSSKDNKPVSRTENYINIIEKTMDELEKTLKEFRCKECNKGDSWKITDATEDYKKL